ncbi:MAG: hypothetical protein Q8O97_03690 [bacterium]|nr:hypothetical protein [bacterium]
MPQQYSQEQLWKLYEKLPEELKEKVFSQETADYIFDICERNQIEEVPKVSYYVGLVLLGVLLPEDLQKALEGELRVKKTVAKSTATEINRFVFYPVKPVLEQLHKMEIEVSAKVTTPEPPTTETETPLPTEQEPEKKQGGPDSYRESIE